MNKWSSAIAGLFAASLMTSAAGAGIIIDDFSDTDAYPPAPGLQLVVGNAIGTYADTDGPLSGVFGDGFRTLQLQVTATSGVAFASTQVIPASEYWTTSNDPNANSIARTIYASALGATVLPPSGSPSDTLFRVTVLTADQDVEVKASLKDIANRNASFTWSDPVAGTVASAFLNDFVSDAGFNFEKVTGIIVEMSGPSNWDGSLGLLETSVVPEPASLLLGLAVTGVVGLAAARRRRKQG
jgi:hypothetical protein